MPTWGWGPRFSAPPPAGGLAAGAVLLVLLLSCVHRRGTGQPTSAALHAYPSRAASRALPLIIGPTLPRSPRLLPASTATDQAPTARAGHPPPPLAVRSRGSWPAWPLPGLWPPLQALCLWLLPVALVHFAGRRSGQAGCVARPPMVMAAAAAVEVAGDPTLALRRVYRTRRGQTLEVRPVVGEGKGKAARGSWRTVLKGFGIEQPVRKVFPSLEVALQHAAAHLQTQVEAFEPKPEMEFGEVRRFMAEGGHRIDLRLIEDGRHAGQLRLAVTQKGEVRPKRFICEPSVSGALATAAQKLGIDVTSIRETKGLKRSRWEPRVVKTPEAEDEGVKTLKEEQMEVMAAVLKNEESVFITGKAGTGKSYLLRVIVHELQRKFGAYHVFVTATTGQAACAIGGTTLHYFAGLRPGQKTAKEVIDHMKSDAKKRWRRAEVLVVDEISMADGQMFDLLNEVAQRIRRNDQPFGGIQLVLCGDFYQLPPVKVGLAATFCFEARCWEQVVQRRFLLSHPHRQSDTNFLAVLNEVRHGQISATTDRALRECLGKAPENDRVPVTVLFPTNKEVDELNETELAKLSDKCGVPPYMAIDEGQKWLLTDCSAPASLKLVVGAQVVLLKNLEVENGLTNGARGVVIGFAAPDKDDADQRRMPQVSFQMAQQQRTVVRTVGPEKWEVLDGGVVVATRRQVPLRLAWAITIHRCQGMTLPKVQLALGNCFTPGMAYVALSRATTLGGVHLLSYKRENIRVEAKVHAYHRRAFPAPEAAEGGAGAPPPHPHPWRAPPLPGNVPGNVPPLPGGVPASHPPWVLLPPRASTVGRASPPPTPHPHRPGPLPAAPARPDPDPVFRPPGLRHPAALRGNVPPLLCGFLPAQR